MKKKRVDAEYIYIHTKSGRQKKKPSVDFPLSLKELKLKDNQNKSGNEMVPVMAFPITQIPFGFELSVIKLDVDICHNVSGLSYDHDQASPG